MVLREFRDRFLDKFGAERMFITWHYNQLSFGFTPGVPLAIILSIGGKHWLHVKEFDKFKPYVPRKWKKGRAKLL